MRLAGIYKAGEWIFDMMLLTLCWIITVVIGLGFTLGPATTAAYGVCFKKIKDIETIRIIPDFFKLLKENIKQSFAGGLLLLLFIYITYFNYSNMKLTGAVFYNYGAVGYLRLFLIIMLTMTFLYLFPMIAYYKAPFKKIMVSAFLLSFSYIVITSLLFIILILIIYAIGITNGLLFFFSAGIYFYISSIMLVNIFSKHAA